MKKLLIALALLFIPAAASAQCNGVFPNGTICGNSTGSSNTPRPTIATSFALGLAVGSSPIASGTTTAPLFNNAGILGNGLIASTWSTYTGFEATSARTVQAKLQDTFSVLDYIGSSGCAPDNVSDCSAAFNAAVQAASDYGAANIQGFAAGTVYVPPGMNCYRIHSSTINLLKNISIKGAGEGSCILADDVDAITLNYVSGYGMPTISDLIIVGENATASRTAIKATGSTTSWLLPLYGLTVRNTMIYQFDVGISSQTVLTTWFQNDWLENINQCFDFIGWGGINTIQGVSCQRGATAVANGTAPNSGITLEAFTYSIGGSLQPEGTIIHSSNINGFATSVDNESAVDVSIDNTSLSATVDAIKTLNIAGGLSVHNNYIALTGVLGAHGFYALGTGSGGQNQTNIESNTFVSSTSTISNGIQINDAGLPGQANFNISKNFISGMGVHDIVAFGPSYVNIDGNFVNSSGTTDSINLGSATTNGNRITNNVTSKAIVANSSDLTAGATREAGNTIAGALQAGTWQVETNSVTSGQLMVGAGGGVQPTGLTTGTGVQTALSHAINTAGGPIAPANILYSTSAPIITSGFGGGTPTISAPNGTAAFRVTIGTAVGSTGVLGMPTAATGWNCYANDITTHTAANSQVVQTAGSASSVTFTGYSDIAGAATWVAGDIIAISCFAF